MINGLSGACGYACGVVDQGETRVHSIGRRAQTSGSRHIAPSVGANVLVVAERYPDPADGVPDLEALPRVLSWDEAIALGYTRDAIKHRVAKGQWRRILPRTYLTADTFGWPDRVASALTFAGPDGLLSGAAALADLGLRCVSQERSILVLVPPANRSRSVAWVRIRATGRMPERALLPGARRVPAARAVADLSLERTGLDDVRTLVAQAVRSGLCTVDELAEELSSGPRNRSGHLRRALAEVDAGAWSAPEARAAQILKRAGLPEFVQNARIDLDGGKHVFADFLWRALRAVLEIDSVEHHLDPVQWRNTMDRHLLLEANGFSVIHRPPSCLLQPRQFARDVDVWLRARSRVINIRPGAL